MIEWAKRWAGEALMGRAECKCLAVHSKRGGIGVAAADQVLISSVGNQRHSLLQNGSVELNPCRSSSARARSSHCCLLRR